MPPKRYSREKMLLEKKAVPKVILHHHRHQVIELDMSSINVAYFAISKCAAVMFVLAPLLLGVFSMFPVLSEFAKTFVGTLLWITLIAIISPYLSSIAFQYAASANIASSFLNVERLLELLATDFYYLEHEHEKILTKGFWWDCNFVFALMLVLRLALSSNKHIQSMVIVGFEVGEFARMVSKSWRVFLLPKILVEHSLIESINLNNKHNIFLPTAVATFRLSNSPCHSLEGIIKENLLIRNCLEVYLHPFGIRIVPQHDNQITFDFLRINITFPVTFTQQLKKVTEALTICEKLFKGKKLEKILNVLTDAFKSELDKNKFKGNVDLKFDIQFIDINDIPQVQIVFAIPHEKIVGKSLCKIIFRATENNQTTFFNLLNSYLGKIALVPDSLSYEEDSFHSYLEELQRVLGLVSSLPALENNVKISDKINKIESVQKQKVGQGYNITDSLEGHPSKDLYKLAKIPLFKPKIKKRKNIFMSIAETSALPKIEACWELPGFQYQKESEERFERLYQEGMSKAQSASNYIFLLNIVKYLGCQDNAYYYGVIPNEVEKKIDTQTLGIFCYYLAKGFVKSNQFGATTGVSWGDGKEKGIMKIRTPEDARLSSSRQHIFYSEHEKHILVEFSCYQPKH